MDDRKSILLLLLMLSLTGAVYLGLLAIAPSNKFVKKMNVFSSLDDDKSQISAYSPRAEALVNRHLLVTNQEVQLQEQRMRLENKFYAPQLGDSIWPKIDQNKKSFGVDHSADRNENNAYQDLNRYKHQLSVGDPDHVIQQQLTDTDKQKEYENSYKENYARQFVENARAHGYEVELDSNFVVKSVKTIRRPSQNENIQIAPPTSSQAR